MKCCKPVVKKSCCSKAEDHKKCKCVIREIPAADTDSKSFVLSNPVSITIPKTDFSIAHQNNIFSRTLYVDEADGSPPLFNSPLYLLYNVIKI